VSDCCPVYPDVFVITEFQELLPDELGPVVSDDRVGDPKAGDDVLDKAYHLFVVDFGQGPSLDPLSELIDCDKQVGDSLECFFEGSQEAQTPHGKGSCDEDVWSSWASAWICLTKYWHPLRDLTI
jgi:hypothetical protein